MFEKHENVTNLTVKSYFPNLAPALYNSSFKELLLRFQSGSFLIVMPYKSKKNFLSPHSHPKTFSPTLLSISSVTDLLTIDWIEGERFHYL